MAESIDNAVPAEELDLNPLLTVTEVCEHLRISRTLLYDFIRSGQLRTIKLGRRRLIHGADLAQLLETLRGPEGGY